MVCHLTEAKQAINLTSFHSIVSIENTLDNSNNDNDHDHDKSL